MTEPGDPSKAFLEAAVWHGSLEEAEMILAKHPRVARSSIHAAAVLGDHAMVRSFLAVDRTNATAKGGPHGWDALTYLCFSKYLRLEPERSAGFLRAATALLDAGASACTGFYDPKHQPEPGFESVLYGAAGVAHHAGLTRLLLEHGADPNDEEVAYHAPETDDNAALMVLVETGKLTEESLATMLLRKADWHDYGGMVILLEHGADPNRMTHWGITALHQAIRRDNDVRNIEAMLEHRANPTIVNKWDDRSTIAAAARRGRRDVLDRFERRGFAIDLEGVDSLIAACARNNTDESQALAAHDPRLVDRLHAEGGRVLAEFAGNGNADGVRNLLDLGLEIGSLFKEGDGYWDVATDSTALHLASWRAHHSTVKLLIARGAAIDVRDGQNRTPLMLAVRACVDSFWQSRRSPESVRALLEAGASVQGVPFPSGYTEVDELLEAHGATA
jgi:ankyrin repeat protein